MIGVRGGLQLKHMNLRGTTNIQSITYSKRLLKIKTFFHIYLVLCKRKNDNASKVIPFLPLFTDQDIASKSTAKISENVKTGY